jgi:hypothetical protein
MGEPQMYDEVPDKWVTDNELASLRNEISTWNLCSDVKETYWSSHQIGL